MKNQGLICQPFMRLVWVFLCSLGFVLCVTPSRAQLKATPEEVDLGKRAQNQTVATEVKLSNEGAEPIEILHVGADCSCTAATPDKTSLKPGESTALKINLETRSYQGEIHRRLQIQTTRGDVFVQVRALVTAYENWSISPYPIIMPSGVKGVEASTPLEFTYTGSGEATLKSLTSTPEWISAKLVKQEGKTFTYLLTRSSQAPAGNHTVKVRVETTDEVNPRLDLSIFTSVVSSVRLRPSPLIMPLAKVGQRTSLEAKLSGWSQSAAPRFELKSGDVNVLERSGEDITVRIEMVSPASGSFTQLFRVFAGDALELEVPLVLRVQP